MTDYQTDLENTGKRIFDRYDHWTTEQKTKFIEAIQKSHGDKDDMTLQLFLEEEHRKEKEAKDLMDELEKLI